jgi:hypothetical protein
MAIIISKNGANARRVEMTPFSKEGYLQEYIHDNPESIPIYDIEETGSICSLSSWQTAIRRSGE